MSDIYTWLPRTNKLYVLYTVIGILSLLLCDIFVDFYLLNKMWMEIYGFRCRIIKLYIYFVHICRRNIVQNSFVNLAQVIQKSNHQLQTGKILLRIRQFYITNVNY